jgi:hypothetical protein
MILATIKNKQQKNLKNMQLIQSGSSSSIYYLPSYIAFTYNNILDCDVVCITTPWLDSKQF